MTRVDTRESTTSRWRLMVELSWLWGVRLILKYYLMIMMVRMLRMLMMLPILVTPLLPYTGRIANPLQTF